MFIKIATGNVWTEVPIVQVNVGDSTAIDLTMRYDTEYIDTSISVPVLPETKHQARLVGNPFGGLWTHNYATYGFREGFSWTDVDSNGNITSDDWFTLMGADGRRRSFLIDATTKKGPDIDTMHTMYAERIDNDDGTDDDLYRIHYPDGSFKEFRLKTEEEFKAWGFWPGYANYDWYELARIVDPRGLETTFEYINTSGTFTGHLESIEDPYGNTVEFQYGYIGAYPTLNAIVHPDGNVTSIGYAQTPAGDRGVSHIIDPTGRQRNYEYDSSNRIVKETLYNGTQYVVEYATTNGYHQEQVTIRDVDTNGSGDDIIVQATAEVFGSAETTWSPGTDGAEGEFGQLVRIEGGEVYVSDGRGKTWTYTIDSYSRVTAIEAPSDSDGVDRDSTYTFDVGTSSFSANSHTLAGGDTGKLRSIQVGTFSPTYYEYDPDTRLVTAMVDPEGNRTNYERTDSNWPYFVTKVEVDGSEDYTAYAYSSTNGEVQTVTRHGGSLPTPKNWVDTHTWTHYGDGRVQKHVVESDVMESSQTWNFNSNGTLASMVRDEGGLAVTTTYTYDAMSRVKTVTLERSTNPDVETEFFYDAAGRLIATSLNSNGLNLTSTMVNDGEGNILRMVDPRGMVTRYEFDNRDRLTKWIVDSNGFALTTSYEYDLSNNLTKITNPRGKETDITYYNFNLPKQVTNAEGYDTIVMWDAKNNLKNVKREKSPGSNNYFETSLVYDGLSRLTSRSIDTSGLNLTSSFEYDAESGGGGCGCSSTEGTPLVSKITDPAGEVTYFKYDPLHRLVETVRKVGSDDGPAADGDDVVSSNGIDDANRRVDRTDPEGRVVRQEYDAAVRFSKLRKDPNGVNLTSSFWYDGAGPARRIGAPNGNLTTRTIDAVNRITSISDFVGLVRSNAYDSGGYRTKVINGESDDVTSNSFDTAGRLEYVEDPNGEKEFYTYDANNNLTQFTDREGRITTYEYDDLDRLEKTTEDAATSGLRRVTEYTYDGNDNLLTLKAYTGTNGTGTTQVTTYEYDNASRVTKVTYPDNDAGSNGIVRYTYNPAGTVATRVDQKGVTTTYTYDDLHRLTGRTYSDAVTPDEAFEYDKSGRLTVASNGIAVVNFGYDDVGRVDDAELVINGVSYDTEFYYNEALRFRQVTYPGSGPTITKDYSARGLLEGVVEEGSKVLADKDYDLSDRMESIEFGFGGVQEYTYNPNGWITDIGVTDNGRTLEELAYGYDKVGNPTYREVETPGREHLSELYQHDTLHRLLRFDRGTLNGGHTAVTEVVPKPFTQTRHWQTLDMLGNWKSTSTTIDGQASTETREVNAVNEYLNQVIDSTTTAFSNDNNGNLTDDGDQLYEYDAENRLIRVRRKSDNALIQEYEYDALGRRVHTVASNGVTETITTHVYADTPACIAEYDSSTSEGDSRQRWFVHGENFPDPLVMVDSTGLGDYPSNQREYLYYMKDMLGSVTGLVDDDGNVVERYIYDPYGKTEIATVTFYHDHDLNGEIDASDVAHYDWCTSTGFPERAQDPMCVFVHNRDGDYELTAADGTLFAAYVASGSYNSNGAPAPEEWERLRTPYLDANNDQLINLYDWYGFQVCEGVTTSSGGMNDDLCLFLYDLDDDGDVDLNEGQEGCNLFTDRWGTAGDGHPGQATGSRFGNPFMWTGQRNDAPVGLYHFVYRSYSPEFGRWLQRDPLGPVDSLNIYEYARTNSLLFVDPLGLKITIEKGKDDKGNEATDEEKAKVEKALDDAKSRRDPRNSKRKGEGVKNIEELEESPREIKIKVIPGPGISSCKYDGLGKCDPKRGTTSTVKIYVEGCEDGWGMHLELESTLVHELRHAWIGLNGLYPRPIYVKGKSFEEIKEDRRRKVELDATEVENEHRRNKGIPQRKAYQDWPARQFPVFPQENK